MNDKFVLGDVIDSYTDLNLYQCERTCLDDSDCVIFTYMHEVCHTFDHVQMIVDVPGSMSGYTFIPGAPTQAPSYVPTESNLK